MKQQLYIPDTEIEKVSKLVSKYIEFREFSHSDTSKGYFCASCIYFWQDHDDCSIVYAKGESSDGADSDRIAPYGMCALWKPNWEVIRKKETKEGKKKHG